MIQTVVATFIGLVAVYYVGKKIVIQFTKTETDPKCDNCPIPDLMNDKKSNDK